MKNAKQILFSSTITHEIPNRVKQTNKRLLGQDISNYITKYYTIFFISGIIDPFINYSIIPTAMLTAPIQHQTPVS